MRNVSRIYSKHYKKIPKVLFMQIQPYLKTFKKINKSTYQKDRVFNELYQKLEDKDFDKDIDKIPLRTPFSEKKKATLIDRLFTVLENHFKEFMQILLI